MKFCLDKRNIIFIFQNKNNYFDYIGIKIQKIWGLP